MANFKNGPSLRMQKARKWMNESMAPAMGRIGNQTHLASLRDGFAIITPLIIASAVAVILLTSVFGGWGTERSSLLGVFAKWAGDSTTWLPVQRVYTGFTDSAGALTDWGKASDEMTRVLGAMNNYGLGLLTVYFTFGFGFFLAKARGNNSPEIGGLVALGCFFIATAGGTSSANYINYARASAPLAGDFKGSSGVFTAIVVTILSVEVYCWLSKIKRLELNLPAGVPPAVARSFAKLIPVIGAGLAVTTVFAIVAIPTHLTNAAMLTSQSNTTTNEIIIGVSNAAPNSFYNIGDLIYMAVQAPFIYAATIDGANLGIAVLYVFLVGLFWFFGVHGTNVVNGIFNAVWLTLLATNAELLRQGTQVLAEQGSIFVGGTFDAFVFFGGTGATLPFILGTVWFSKRASEQAIAKFSIPAGVFNINEPVVFGYPIVANLRYVIPYITVMPILTVSTWVFYKAFGTTLVAVQLPWTAPAGIGSLFATQFDYTAFLIALINFALAFVIWLPFTLLSNRIKDVVPTPAEAPKAPVAAMASVKGVK